MSNSVDEKTSAEKADIELDTSGSHGSMHNKMKQLLASFSALDYISPLEIPNIDLYIEQVTSFLDNELASARRTPDDKTLTKTMINNYTKNHVLPAPVKKKYSRDHVLTLILIYYFKNFLSIKDVKAIFDPITEKYFGSEEDFNMYNVYEHLVDMVSAQSDATIRDLVKKYDTSMETFANIDASPEDVEMLQQFGFICMLAFDVYVKKMLIEELIDMSN